jgi:hypothetical protein
MRLAGAVDQPLDLLAKLMCLGVLSLAFEQGQFLLQFLGLALKVSQARLPVFGFETLIGGVGVGDENAIELFPQQTLGGLGRAMSIELEAG